MTNTEMRSALVTRIEKLRPLTMQQDQDKAVDAIVEMAACVGLVRCIDLALKSSFGVRQILDRAHQMSLDAAKGNAVVLDGHREIYQASLKLLQELS